MHRLLLNVLLILCGLLLPGSGLTAEPVPDRQKLILEDRRFDAPVTLRFRKSPLSDVVEELGRQTGTEMRASADVADEPAIVFAAQQPAREVMRQVARHFNYRWARFGKPESYRYELYQDLRSKKEEEALRQRERSLRIESLRGSIRQRVELSRRPRAELLQLADLFDRQSGQPKQPADVELQRRPEWQMMRQAGRSTPLRETAGGHWPALARVALALTPEQWSVLLDGRVLRFSSRGEPGMHLLPPAMVKELRAARPEMFPPGTRLAFGQADGAAALARLDGMMAEQWQRALGYRLHVRLEEPGGPMAPAVLRLRVKTVMPEDFVGEQQMNAPGLEVSSEEVPYPALGAEEPDATARSEPSLRKAVLWAAARPREDSKAETVDTLNHLLPQIAEAYRVNLIADAYRHPRFSIPDWSKPGERSLADVLDGCARPIARWRKEGAFIRVRRKTWYRDRLAEIPRRVASRAAQRLRKDRVLSLERQADLALTLRDEQLRNFEGVMREHGIDFEDPPLWILPGTKEFLRAYGSLTPVQRQHLRTGGKILLKEMSAQARRWMVAALDPGDLETDEMARFTEPAAGLLAPRVQSVVTRTPEGFAITYRSVDPGFGSLLMHGTAPRGAALSPGREQAGNVIFAYVYDRAFRFFYPVPRHIRLIPPPDLMPAPGQTPLVAP